MEQEGILVIQYWYLLSTTKLIAKKPLFLFFCVDSFKIVERQLNVRCKGRKQL